MLENIKNFYLKNKYLIIVTLIFIVGILIRTIGISNYPNALNVDEASAGYEAYCIYKTGADRNGIFLPVYLVAWGSGQNALLTYFIIPFIRLFGLNTLSVRLPMLLISLLSLLAFYSLLKDLKDKKLAIIGLAFFTICPWHIMKSRWGLESNLFPDFILFFLCFLIKGLKNNKKSFYYLSFIIAGLSCYTYGTSFFFLPLFLIPLLLILLRKKEITLRQAIFSLLIVFFITLPLILFVAINTFDLPQINLLFMTIPRLTVNRYEELTSIFSLSFLKESISNLIGSLKILLLQYDGLPWNALKFFGTIYPISIFFCILGICLSFWKKNKDLTNQHNQKLWVNFQEACYIHNHKLELNYTYIFNLYFIICIFLMIVCEPNINRLNVVFIPIIYFTVIGIYFILNHCRNKIIPIIIATIYCLLFFSFIPNYFKQDWNTYYTFESDLEEVIDYITHLENKEIHITNKIKEPYIYILFYSNYSPKEFYETVKYTNPNSAFRQVTHFGNYYFENIENINLENTSYIYVIKKEDIKKYSLQKNKIKLTEFKKYIIIEQID